MALRNRVEVMHGVNLSEIGRRDPEHYGDVTYPELERVVGQMGKDLGLTLRFMQTNHEGEFVEHLHRLEGIADGVVLNPGAWTHYAWSIHDALELTGLPAVEVHLSDVSAREEWRRVSVVRDLCVASVAGKGVEGYREALTALRGHLEVE
jgi:3-dehydroquinate dehydratase-2